MILSFLSTKYFEGNKIIDEYQEYTIAIEIKLPEVTNLSTRKKYDQNLTKYEVLDTLTGGFDATDEIIEEELMKYINLNTFPKGSKFKVAYNRQHFDKNMIEIGIETNSYYDSEGKIVNENKAYSFLITGAMSKSTRISENSKYSEETRTLDQIRNFLLKDPRKSNEINVKNLSKYLIIDNINEYTKFYLDKISLKSGFGGFVNIELSYENYLNNAGENVNSTRTFEFMVLTLVDHNSTSMYRNKNRINSRGYKSTLNFLKGDISGEDADTNFLDRTALSQWFTIRNVPEDAKFILEKYGYATDGGGQIDKNNIEIEFSVDKFIDDKGEIKLVDELNLEEGNQEESKGASTYQSICKGTIPIHIENTSIKETGASADLTVYDLKNSLLVKDQMMSYAAIKKYMIISDIPVGTKFYLDTIAKEELTDKTVNTNIKFYMTKWYEDGEIRGGKKNLELNIISNRSYATDLTIQKDYKQSITLDGFRDKLLEGSPGGSQVNVNSDFFKSYFNLVGSNTPIVKLGGIDSTEDSTGGYLKVHFILDNTNDEFGERKDNVPFTFD
ncbi:MAG: hypothetical protein ACRC42_03970, partial [Mycoplasma sp.]